MATRSTDAALLLPQNASQPRPEQQALPQGSESGGPVEGITGVRAVFTQAMQLGLPAAVQTKHLVARLPESWDPGPSGLLAPCGVFCRMSPWTDSSTAEVVWVLVST
jgi:hypothetical protein